MIFVNIINRYQSRLNYFVQMLDKFIEPDAIEILKGKISGLITCPADKKTDGRWSLLISPDYPLKFHPCDINGNKVQVDFSCDIEGIVPNSRHKENPIYKIIEKYKILIRVWSLENKLSFREGIDSDTLIEKIIGNDMKRVILRFHIDKKIPGTQIEEPLYHMHFGGLQQGNEIAWFPKSIDVPRFHFFPLDIILATEFILLNFFSIESYKLREDPEWKSIVISAQEIFLKPCISQYNCFINDYSNTFLTHSVNWN